MQIYAAINDASRTDKHRNVMKNLTWKEDGCRKDYTTLVGLIDRRKRSARDAATWRKVRNQRNVHTGGSGHEWSWQGVLWEVPTCVLRESTESTENSCGPIWRTVHTKQGRVAVESRALVLIVFGSRYVCCTRRPGMTTVLTLSTSVMSGGRVKKSTFHLGASCKLKNTSIWRYICVGNVSLRVGLPSWNFCGRIGQASRSGVHVA